MKLFLKDDRIWEKNEDDILQEFANSDLFKDKDFDEKIRLALFISYEEPNGLNSTFYGYQFEKLWDYWCGNKYKFIKIISIAEITQL